MSQAQDILLICFQPLLYQQVMKERSFLYCLPDITVALHPGWTLAFSSLLMTYSLYHFLIASIYCQKGKMSVWSWLKMSKAGRLKGALNIILP